VQSTTVVTTAPPPIVTTAPPPTVVTPQQPAVVYPAPTARTETVTLCGSGLVYSPRLGYCVQP
jgi:hypothetical protein